MATPVFSLYFTPFYVIIIQKKEFIMDKYHLYTGEDKQQRLRAIVITVIFAVIVLGLAIWAIVAIVSGTKSKSALGTETETVATVTDNDTREEQIVYPETTETPEETEAPAEAETVEEPTPAPAAPANDMPSTGPEETLPLILVAGMLVTYITSKKMNLNEA